MGLRRSLLFVPGNNPGMVQNAGVLGADTVILDLEDAVAPSEKDAARVLLAQALKTVDYGNCEIAIRINSLDSFAQEDLAMLVPLSPNAIMVPKVNTADDIKQVAQWLQQYEVAGGRCVEIIALIETPVGIANCMQIAAAHERLTALAFGAEDYTAGLGAQRTKEGQEILTARCLLANAAAAYSIQALDTPFTDVNDDEGLKKDVALSRQLGFKGKLSINPRHIEAIHEGFTPTAREINWARRVLEIIKEAEEQGAGVVALDGKMIDKPIVDRAKHLLQTAEALGVGGKI